MNLTSSDLAHFTQSMKILSEGFQSHPIVDSPLQAENMEKVLTLTAERLHDNYPYHHPFYMGQMLKPPHQVAQLAYMLALNINPNNHALDGGRASSEMEKEAVSEIAKMFGWKGHLGHLCGGGTMANFEALWIARELSKETDRTTVLASAQSHYTHARLSAVLGSNFRAVACDDVGAMDISSLRDELNKGDVATVVVTLGTTLSGSIDPLPKVLELRSEFEFRIHVDTAYGGYFTLVENLDPYTRMAFDAISQVDSLVIDPHKHGLQPYGCGCVLFKDPTVGRFYNHDSPYTYFSSDELHLGEISLECSRPGASAVALWATQQAFPMERQGLFAKSLQTCRQAALNFYQWLHESEQFNPLFGPQLDIVCWAPRASSASETSRLSQQIFERTAAKGVHLAVAYIPQSMCVALQDIQQWDQDHVLCLRACVMKPDHLENLEQIQRILLACTQQIS